MIIEENGIQYKVCNRCKQKLPISKFSKLQASADGYDWTCRSCKHDIYLLGKNKKKIAQAEQKKNEKKSENILDSILKFVPVESDEQTFAKAKSATEQKIVEKKLDDYSTAELVDQLKKRNKKVFLDPTPRDLMIELYEKGYRGELKYTIEKTVDLSSLR